MCSIMLEICQHVLSDWSALILLAEQHKFVDVGEGERFLNACELPHVLRQYAVSVEGVLDTISSSHHI